MNRLSKGLSALFEKEENTVYEDHSNENETTPDVVFAKGFVEHVKEDLIDINKTFFRIGFRLNEAQRCGYYKTLGYKSIDECAESLFGFKRTTTYDLIKIFNTFCDERHSMNLPKRWEGFNKSKLLLMSQPLHSDIAKICAPSDTYERIKYAMKLHSDCGFYYCSSFSDLSLEEYIAVLEEHKLRTNLPPIKEDVDLSVISDESHLTPNEEKTIDNQKSFGSIIAAFCLARKYVVEKHDLVNQTRSGVPLSKFADELYKYFVEEHILSP